MREEDEGGGWRSRGRGGGERKKGEKSAGYCMDISVGILGLLDEI